ncbi:MAG: LacI family transcriptional regulator [Glaciecola sp.]|jgi:LacI family transcriptional regulator
MGYGHGLRWKLVAAMARPAKRPTMLDVARRADVSLKTVSRVINGEDGVASATAERVGRATRELGFRRNDAARNLRTGASATTVGIVIGDVGNPFYAAMHRAIEQVADSRDHLVVAASTGEDPNRERELLVELCRRRVDGLLVVPTTADHGYLNLELDLGTPVVALDRRLIGVEGADCVVPDNVGAAREGVERLIRAGHTVIAALSTPHLEALDQRIEGYQQAMEGAGLAPWVIDVDQDPVAARAATAAAVDGADPPTAVFSANNRLSVGVVGALLRSHADVEVLAFDTFDLADVLPLDVHIIAHDAAELGRIGANLLFDRLEGYRGESRERVVPTRSFFYGRD